MAIEMAKAKQLVQSVFTFDKVGDLMGAIRKNPSSQELQLKLVKALIDHAIPLASDKSPGSIAMITKAAEERSKQYVDGVKASKSGCGGA
ncbi:MAG: hypothetical protein NTV30_04915 [Chloroflexi bacterium]|nr:hypothetical protein [Chloroflexota bacterium]